MPCCNKQPTETSDLLGNDSSTEALKTLHWLPIHLRIQFKIATLVFRSLHGTAPKYLCDLIKLESNDRYRLRSREQQNILAVPFTKCKTFADRAFSVAGPKVWNKPTGRTQITDRLWCLQKATKDSLVSEILGRYLCTYTHDVIL